MFEVSNTGTHTIISAKDADYKDAVYKLCFDSEYAQYPEYVKRDGREVHFIVNDQDRFSYRVTGRDFCEYVAERCFPDLPLSPDLRYVEIGPGMGGLLKQMTDKFGTRMRHKPVAIEPSDIGLMKDFLQFAVGCGDITQRHKDIVAEYVSRLELLEDSSKITLLNMKLGDALRNFPWLEGYADVVVELAGPSTYTETEGLPFIDGHPAGIVIGMERQLLRPSRVQNLFCDQLK